MENVLIDAVKANDIQRVRAVIRGGDVDVNDALLKRTALHVAAEKSAGCVPWCGLPCDAMLMSCGVRCWWRAKQT